MEGTRPATRDDAPRCDELCRQALAELEGARGGALWMRGETGLVAKALMRPGGLDRLLSQKGRRVVVGTVDAVVVGLAVGRVAAVGEAPVGVIDGCYVEPGARGVGVGRGLLDDLVAWFEGAGCRGVDASAPARRPCHQEHARGVRVQGPGHHHAPTAALTAVTVPHGGAPVVAVGAVVVAEDALLLVRRSSPPQAGRWTIAGGRGRARGDARRRPGARGGGGDGPRASAAARSWGGPSASGPTITS